MAVKVTSRSNDGGRGKKPRARKRAGSCGATKSSSTTTKSSPTSAAPSRTASSSTTKTTNPAKETTPASSSQIVGGYWPSWTASQLPPEKIDWTKYDIMCYAFAEPGTDATVSIPSWDASLLKRMVTSAHAGNTKILLSLGGWGQSKGFSPSVASDTMIAKFVKSIRKVYDTYNLDGIDLDWEYPNNEAAGNYNPADTKNFQTFLQALRAGLPSGALITAAVAQAPWLASSGNPVGSVARAASALDYIMIMNYDVWGSSSNPGPNAPLADLCGNSTQPGASAAASVKQWAAAGMPRSKMLLGSPLYGYVSTSSKTKLKQRSLDDGESTSMRRSIHSRPLSPRYDASVSAAEKRALTSGDGQVGFSSLVSQGVLSLSGSQYVGSGGFTKYWDDCSDTPYLANGQKVITYDDPDSLFDKGKFVKEAGLGGSSVWSIDGDVSSGALIKSIRKGMGLS
ncbi:unnamed protein product [Parajaminaea phylloscopi]